VRKRMASFYASRSRDVDGRIVSYAWRFGDGGTAHGATVSHVYRKTKRYEVRLTVKDDSGATSTRTKWIKVRKH
jgi:PKD repeat protein